MFLNGLLWAAVPSSPMVRKVSFRFTFVLELNLGLAKADPAPPPPVSAEENQGLVFSNDELIIQKYIYLLITLITRQHHIRVVITSTMEAHGHEEFWGGAADRREEAAAAASPSRRALPGREDVLFRVASADSMDSSN